MSTCDDFILAGFPSTCKIVLFLLDDYFLFGIFFLVASERLLLMTVLAALILVGAVCLNCCLFWLFKILLEGVSSIVLWEVDLMGWRFLIEGSAYTLAQLKLGLSFLEWLWLVFKVRGNDYYSGYLNDLFERRDGVWGELFW